MESGCNKCKQPRFNQNIVWLFMSQQKSLVLLMWSKRSYFLFDSPLFKGCQQLIIFHFTLISARFPLTLAPTTCMSSLTATINLIFVSSLAAPIQTFFLQFIFPSQSLASEENDIVQHLRDCSGCNCWGSVPMSNGLSLLWPTHSCSSVDPLFTPVIDWLLLPPFTSCGATVQPKGPQRQLVTYCCVKLSTVSPVWTCVQFKEFGSMFSGWTVYCKEITQLVHFLNCCCVCVYRLDVTNTWVY